MAGLLKYIISIYFNESPMHYSKAFYIMNITTHYLFLFHENFKGNVDCNYPRVAVNTFHFSEDLSWRKNVGTIEVWVSSRCTACVTVCLQNVLRWVKMRCYYSLINCEIPFPFPKPCSLLFFSLLTVLYWHLPWKLQNYYWKKKGKAKFLLPNICYCENILLFLILL